MRTTKSRRLAEICLVLNLCGLAMPASAHNLFMGASFGKSEVGDWCDIDFGDCDDTDSGWKLFIGNEINKNVAIEFSYANLGEVTDVGIAVEAKSLGASAVGMIPLGSSANVFGRFGLQRWDLSSEFGDDSGTDPVYGIGVSVGGGQGLGFRVEWEHFEVEDSEVEFLSFGITFAFK